MPRACRCPRGLILASLAAAAAIALVPPPSLAGGDDPPPPGDLLGLYRLPDATGGSADTLDVLQEGLIYAVLTGCTAGAGLLTYAFEVEPPPGILAAMQIFCESPCWMADFLTPSQVHCNCLSQPLPLADAMTLVGIRYLPLGPGAGDFYLRTTAMADGVMGYVEAGDPAFTIRAMGWAAGSESAPAYSLIARRVVASESRSWGAVKALYRDVDR